MSLRESSCSRVVLDDGPFWRVGKREAGMLADAPLVDQAPPQHSSQLSCESNQILRRVSKVNRVFSLQ